MAANSGVTLYGEPMDALKSLDVKRKRVSLGLFITPEEAHQAYRQFKYKVIRSVAEDITDIDLKNGLLNWVIYER